MDAAVRRLREEYATRGKAELFEQLKNLQPGEHADRNIVDGTDADSRHHQIEKYEDAGPDLGDAGEIARKMSGRGGAHTHHGRCESRCPQLFGALNRSGSLLFSGSP